MDSLRAEIINHPPQFWIALVLGCITTLVFAVNEFEKRTPGLPEEFRPKELTTRHRYLMSFVLYVAGLQVLYVLVCLLGPEAFGETASAGAASRHSVVSGPSFPMWVAVVFIGIVPRVPLLDYLEIAWRRLMHKRAAIPWEAQRIMRTLRNLPLDRAATLQRIEHSAELARGSVTPADVEAAPETATYAWARLSVLVGRLQRLETDRRADDHLDVEFVDRHAGERARIIAEYEKLVRAVTSARGCPEGPETTRDPTERAVADGADHAPRALRPVPEAHAEAVRRLLERIYLFLGCALIARDPEPAALAEATLFLGFVPEAIDTGTREADHALLAVLLAAGVVFVLMFAASLVGARLPVDLRAGWPADPRDAFPYAASALLSYGTAVYLGLRLRRWRMRRRRWFRGRSSRPEIPTAVEYLRVAALAFLGAAIALYACQAVQEAAARNADTREGAEQAAAARSWEDREPADGALRPPATEAPAADSAGASGIEGLAADFQVLAPFAFPPALAALFVCLLLDGAFLDRARAWSIACVAGQVALSASCAGMAAHLQGLYLLEAVAGDPGWKDASMLGHVLFTALAAGTIAFSIGASTACLSRAARRRLSAELEEEANACSPLRAGGSPGSAGRPRSGLARIAADSARRSAGRLKRSGLPVGRTGPPRESTR